MYQHLFLISTAGRVCAKYTIIIYIYNYTQFEDYQYLYSVEDSRGIKISSIFTQDLILTVNWEDENL